MKTRGLGAATAGLLGTTFGLDLLTGSNSTKPVVGALGLISGSQKPYWAIAKAITENQQKPSSQEEGGNRNATTESSLSGYNNANNEYNMNAARKALDSKPLRELKQTLGIPSIAPDESSLSFVSNEEYTRNVFKNLTKETMDKANKMFENARLKNRNKLLK